MTATTATAKRKGEVVGHLVFPPWWGLRWWLRFDITYLVLKLYFAAKSNLSASPVSAFLDMERCISYQLCSSCFELLVELVYGCQQLVPV